MIVRKIDVIVSEAELLQWVIPFIQKQDKVKEIVIRCVAGKVEVDGTIALQLDIPVQTQWAVLPMEGQRVALKLVAVSTSFFGFSGEMMRTALMKALATFLPAVEHVEIVQDSVIVNVGELLKQVGVVVEKDFTAITVQPGQIQVEL